MALFLLWPGPEHLMSPLSISISECLPPEKVRLLVELIRSVQEKAPQAVVQINDEAGQLLGRFVPASGVGATSGETPEFFAELQRRFESAEPALPVEDAFALLDQGG